MSTINPENVKVVIQSLGLISILMVFYQVKNANKWKRLEFTLHPKWKESIEKHKSLIEELTKTEYNTYIAKCKNADEVQFIFDNPELFRTIKNYLNCLEDLSCMMNLNAMDPDYLYKMYSGTIIKAYECFKLFIIKTKEEYDDKLIYIEIEKLYIHWKKTETCEKKSEEKHQRKIEKINQQRIERV